ncbi:MAG: MarR family transcriptional regulator [Candidatus Limnocylindrales bacterium]
MFENNGIANLALGRSLVRQRILALILTEPGVRLHLREIQRRARTSPGTASRELSKLVSAGLIEREAEGNQVYFRGSTSPFAAMLHTLLSTAPATVAHSSDAPVAAVTAATAEADPVALQAGSTVAAQMRAIYRERLRGVYLYGRRASGWASPDSDVELAVVLDRVDRYGEELDRSSAAIASTSLGLGVIVSRVFVSETDWLGRTDGQLPLVRAEAVSL